MPNDKSNGVCRESQEGTAAVFCPQRCLKGCRRLAPSHPRGSQPLATGTGRSPKVNEKSLIGEGDTVAVGEARGWPRYTCQRGPAGVPSLTLHSEPCLGVCKCIQHHLRAHAGGHVCLAVRECLGVSVPASRSIKSSLAPTRPRWQVWSSKSPITVNERQRRPQKGRESLSSEQMACPGATGHSIGVETSVPFIPSGDDSRCLASWPPHSPPAKAQDPNLQEDPRYRPTAPPGCRRLSL